MSTSNNNLARFYSRQFLFHFLKFWGPRNFIPSGNYLLFLNLNPALATGTALSKDPDYLFGVIKSLTRIVTFCKVYTEMAFLKR